MAISFTIDRALPADVDAIYEIFRNSFFADDLDDLHYDRHTLAEVINNDIVLVARGDTILGFAIVYNMTFWGYVDVIAVDKGSRREGVATALLDHIESMHSGWRTIEFCHHTRHDITLALANCRGYYLGMHRYCWRTKKIKNETI